MVKILKQNSNRYKPREFQNLKPSHYIGENPRSMYARVPYAMTQFVLKIAKLFHTIRTAFKAEKHTVQLSAHPA